MKLSEARQKQLKLFSEENPKHQNLMRVADQLKFGENGKVKFGGQDLERPGRFNKKSCLTAIVQD
ncbi:hypothetical protein ML462_01165 [Gramella lutea]|uniref:Uncharacterized protein n=1 Tax=Christiangramia lutea TaxID=1607951 RepID=A0A9X1V2U6_9FLAO|nr:hypothetical protein [Christiangramia lutea]MCH4821768.1 hypothetical protein [Christiangramia lutea]